MKTLLVGLGNPILGDDGIGWRVVEAVEEALEEEGHLQRKGSEQEKGVYSLRRSADLEVEYFSLGGLSLMERLIGYQRVIIVDSIQTQGGQLGQVFTFLLDSLTDLSAGHTTAAHDTSLQTALALGRQMDAAVPDEVMVVAVEAKRVYDFSDELTPAVAAAIPEARAAVLSLLQEEVKGEA